MRPTLPVLVSVACHGSPRATAPPADNQDEPPAVEQRIVIVQDGAGVLLLDPATGGAVAVADSDSVGTTWQQRGPYLVGEFGTIDLRDDPIAVMTLDPDFEAVVREPYGIGVGPGGDVIAAGAQDHLTLWVDGATRSIAWPEPAVNAVAISPDGTTVAVVAGPEGDGDAPLDLYLLDVSDDAFTRRTDEGIVVDVAFVDDDTVVLTRDGDADFTLLDLGTAKMRDLHLSDGWDPSDLDDYLISAPRLPIQHEERWRRGLLDPDTGEILEGGWSDPLLAVAPDGSSAAFTTECRVAGGLVQVLDDGTTRTLRDTPEDAACREEPAWPYAASVSVVYTTAGALVHAIPAPDGAGWQVRIDDRLVLDSERSLRVFAWPD